MLNPRKLFDLAHTAWKAGSASQSVAAEPTAGFFKTLCRRLMSREAVGAAVASIGLDLALFLGPKALSAVQSTPASGKKETLASVSPANFGPKNEPAAERA